MPVSAGKAKEVIGVQLLHVVTSQADNAVRVCVQQLAPWAVLFSLAHYRKRHMSGTCCCQGRSFRCTQICS